MVMVTLVLFGAVLFFGLAGKASAATIGTTGAGATNAASTATAKTPFYYGAWLPFWTTTAGEQEVAVNLDDFNEISPFSYEIVGNNGTIQDDLGIDTGAWNGWFSAVRDDNVKIIPTIAWFDTGGIYNLLSVASTRQAEETKIAQLAVANDFDGIDIDFEAMSPATRPYFSLFIEGLAERLHPLGKTLTCSVVPRTPPSSLYVNPPTNIVYPENYSVLNEYCDEVRIEAYDQDQADIQLDASKGGDGTLYGPVADPDWVTKLIQYAVQYINPKKIMLGIPTYGYEYEVSWSAGVTEYQRVRAWDFFGAMDRADSLGITPMRDNAGELSFTFASTTYIQDPPDLISYVSSTEPAILQNVAPGMTTFFVSFPDATSELQKVALAKEYGLRGVMFFKVDGDIDPAIWNSL